MPGLNRNWHCLQSIPYLQCDWSCWGVVVRSQGGWTPGIHRWYWWGNNILSLLVYRSIHYAAFPACFVMDFITYLYSPGGYYSPLFHTAFRYAIAFTCLAGLNDKLSCKKQTAENCFQWSDLASGDTVNGPCQWISHGVGQRCWIHRFGNDEVVLDVFDIINDLFRNVQALK